MEMNDYVNQKRKHRKVLANLFMHYVFDDFMSREYPYIPWVR